LEKKEKRTAKPRDLTPFEGMEVIARLQLVLRQELHKEYLALEFE